MRINLLRENNGLAVKRDSLEPTKEPFDENIINKFD